MSASYFIDRFLAKARGMQACVAEDAIGELLHLLVKEIIALVHVIKERSQIRTANLVNAAGIRNPHQQFSICVYLQTCRLANMNMGIDDQ